MKTIILTLISSLVFSFAYAETKDNNDLKREIQSKYGIAVLSVGGNYDKSNYVSYKMYRFFFDNFIAQAKKLGLNVDGKKRFFPVEMPLIVYPENWDSRNSNVSYFGPDIGFDDKGNMRAGHKSARGAVRFIMENFPLEGTKEAAELELRNLAVRTAIMDIIQVLADKGVDVQSCIFSVSVLCSINSMDYIAYNSQEKLLQGLLNLQADVDSGKEVGSLVNVAATYWPLLEIDERPWNRWFVNDEKTTRNKIVEYMDRLR